MARCRLLVYVRFFRSVRRRPSNNLSTGCGRLMVQIFVYQKQSRSYVGKSFCCSVKASAAQHSSKENILQWYAVQSEIIKKYQESKGDPSKKTGTLKKRGRSVVVCVPAWTYHVNIHKFIQQKVSTPRSDDIINDK